MWLRPLPLLQKVALPSCKLKVLVVIESSPAACDESSSAWAGSLAVNGRLADLWWKFAWAASASLLASGARCWYLYTKLESTRDSGLSVAGRQSVRSYWQDGGQRKAILTPLNEAQMIRRCQVQVDWTNSLALHRLAFDQLSVSKAPGSLSKTVCTFAQPTQNTTESGYNSIEAKNPKRHIKSRPLGLGDGGWDIAAGLTRVALVVEVVWFYEGVRWQVRLRVLCERIRWRALQSVVEMGWGFCYGFVMFKWIFRLG